MTGKKYRFEFTDVLIIMLAAVMCVLIAVSRKPVNKEPNGEVYYTLTVCGVGTEVEAVISASDTLTDENGQVIGTVQQIISKEASVTLYDEKSFSYVKGYDHSKRDIDIKISSKATIENGSYSVGNTRICVGEIYKIHTSDFYAEGRCTSLQIRGEEE